jgi:UDP-glucose 4-epimerase
MNYHILVTGGAGFIGSHLVDALVLRGYRVSVVDLQPASEVELPPEVSYYQMDLLKPETIELIKQLQPDVIYHLAANANVAKSVKEPVMDYEINYGVTAKLLEVATQIGVKRFIFASTGGALSSEHTILPTPEYAPADPKSPYALHKLMSERLGEFYRSTRGLPFVALRMSNVYGPRQMATCGEANVIATFAERMVKHEATKISGTGLQTRDYIYVEDAVQAFLLVLDHPEVRGPYNIGSEVETDIQTIHRAMASYLGYTQPVIQAPADTGAPQRSCLDIARAERELGWKPRVPFNEGLIRTMEWHRQHAKNPFLLKQA